jgi:hypothetical protein
MKTSFIPGTAEFFEQLPDMVRIIASNAIPSDILLQ